MDYFTSSVLGAILASGVINLAALGAFYMTPALRTISNRFVINLLVVNLLGCLVLSLLLLVNGITLSKALGLLNDTSTTIQMYNTTISEILTTTSDVAAEYYGDTFVTAVTTVIEQNDEFINGGFLAEHRQAIQMIYDRRYWTLDLVVALSSLSVLLIVGDTWCAITDPLRYHSHMSGTKAWVLILGVWGIASFFGILSLMRVRLDPQDTLYRSADAGPMFLRESLLQNVYGKSFAYVYFSVVILMPIVMVCGMYWRIFSEARDNGLRVRKNGSSPLLQSALNLGPSAATSTIVSAMPAATTNGLATVVPVAPPRRLSSILQVAPHNGPPHHVTMGKAALMHPYSGLTMKIDGECGEGGHHNNTTDHNDKCNNNNSNHLDTEGNKCSNNGGAMDCLKPLIPIHNNGKKFCGPAETGNNLEIPPNHCNGSGGGQNIMLTLSRANENPMRRNNSARHLVLLENAERHNGIRQVHSTPDLHKYANQEQSSYILPLPPVNAPNKALTCISSIRHRLSNASSLFKYREESRTARISVMVVIMFILSYLPYGITVLMPSCDTTSLAICCMLVGNISSPIIFAYRNKRVRRGVRRIARIDKQTNERLQKRRITVRAATPKRAKHLAHQQSAPAVVSAVERSASKVSTYSKSSNRFFNRRSSGGAGVDKQDSCVVEIEKGVQQQHQQQQQQKREACKVHMIGKRSILERVCGHSLTLKWGCATDSCTDDNTVRGVEV